jgi:hypothetical protein
MENLVSLGCTFWFISALLFIYFYSILVSNGRQWFAEILLWGFITESKQNFKFFKATNLPWGDYKWVLMVVCTL